MRRDIVCGVGQLRVKYLCVGYKELIERIPSVSPHRILLVIDATREMRDPEGTAVKGDLP